MLQTHNIAWRKFYLLLFLYTILQTHNIAWRKFSLLFLPLYNVANP